MGLPLDAIVETSIRATYAGQTVMNVWHYRVITPSSLPDVEDEMNAFLGGLTAVAATSMFSRLKAATPDGVLYNQATAQAIYPTRYRRAVMGLGGTGARPSTSAGNLAAVVTKQTMFSGRNQVGSTHVVLSTFEDVLNGLVSDELKLGPLTDLCGAINSILTGSAGGGSYQPVLYHRGPNAFPKWTDLNAVFPQPQARVMRRRTVGVGI